MNFTKPNGKRRVVVTGGGMVSALGANVPENWDNLVKGKSGITPISIIDASVLDTQIAAQADDKFEDFVNERIQKRQRKQMTRTVRMWMASAIEAVEDWDITIELSDSYIKK